MFDFYITPNEYEIAEQNGICKKTLEMRIREYAWDKQRALTEPVRLKRELDLPNEVIEHADRNGIEYSVLSQRILQLNWDIEKACTEPLFDYSNHLVEVNKSRRKYPQELYELAKVNGIHERTFRRRVKNGMDMYEAATRPTATRQEIARMGKEASSLGRFQYGKELRV